MINLKKIRVFLKKTENKLISESMASRVLNMDIKATREAVKYMESQGFIQDAGIDGCWSLGMRGKVLVHVKSSQIFKKSTLNKHLELLLERVQTVNLAKDYPYLVNRMKLVGEYPVVRDGKALDIVYSLTRKKIPKREYDEAARELRQESSRSFNNLAEYYGYPQEAIRYFLQSNCHALKLNQYEQEEIRKIEGLILFEISVDIKMCRPWKYVIVS